VNEEESKMRLVEDNSSKEMRVVKTIQHCHMFDILPVIKVVIIRLYLQSCAVDYYSDGRALYHTAVTVS